MDVSLHNSADKNSGARKPGISVNRSTKRKSSTRRTAALRAVAFACLLFPLLFPRCIHSQGGGSAEHIHPLRTVLEFQRLSNAEAEKAYVVEFDGVVTYSDPEWGLFFFHDLTGSLFIDVHYISTKFPLGARVHVSGVTSPGPVSPIVLKASIHASGRGILPIPERRSLAELNAQLGESQYVETQGVLQTCDMKWNRVCFRIQNGNAISWVVVPEPDSVAAQRLIGATVKVKGVSGSHMDASNKRTGAQVFVEHLADIEVLKPGPSASLPILRNLPFQLGSIREVISLSNAEAIKARPVEFEGVVTYSDPEWGLLFVHDQTGSIYINVHGSSTQYSPGTRVLVDGVTGVGDLKPIVARPVIQVIGRGSLVKPNQRSIAELNAGGEESSVVTTQGVLHACDKTWTRICFRIVDGPATAWVVVPHPDSPAAQQLIGATVRVNGVSGVHLDAARYRSGLCPKKARP